MPRPRKITDQMRERIQQVLDTRKATPSDKQLAREAGCTVRGLRAYIQRWRDAQADRAQE
jgi:hypothetical protein